MTSVGEVGHLENEWGKIHDLLDQTRRLREDAAFLSRVVRQWRDIAIEIEIDKSTTASSAIP